MRACSTALFASIRCTSCVLLSQLLARVLPDVSQVVLDLDVSHDAIEECREVDGAQPVRDVLRVATITNVTIRGVKRCFAVVGMTANPRVLRGDPAVRDRSNADRAWRYSAVGGWDGMNCAGWCTALASTFWAAGRENCPYTNPFMLRLCGDVADLSWQKHRLQDFAANSNGIRTSSIALPPRQRISVSET